MKILLQSKYGQRKGKKYIKYENVKKGVKDNKMHAGIT